MAQDVVRSLIAATAAALVLAAASVAHAQITFKSPSWNELSPQERQVLAPLAPDWDKLDVAALKRMNADDTADILADEVCPSTRQPRDQLGDLGKRVRIHNPPSQLS